MEVFGFQLSDASCVKHAKAGVSGQNVACTPHSKVIANKEKSLSMPSDEFQLQSVPMCSQSPFVTFLDVSAFLQANPPLQTFPETKAVAGIAHQPFS